MLCSPTKISLGDEGVSKSHPGHNSSQRRQKREEAAATMTPKVATVSTLKGLASAPVSRDISIGL